MALLHHGGLIAQIARSFHRFIRETSFVLRHCKVSERVDKFAGMFFHGLLYHSEASSSPYDDREHSLVVLLTFAIFSAFVVLYLTVGIVWALAGTAFAVALSFCYLNARRRAAPSRATAVARARLAASRSDGSGLDRPEPAVLRLLPAFAYTREGGSGEAAAAAAGSGWAQCVICLGLVQVGELVRRLPACKHLFHVDCIDMWLSSHSTCPICRAAVAELADGLPSEPAPV